MNQRRKIYCMWLIIIIYPFLFLWQGLNFSDEGNALTIYQLVFAAPQSISDTFGTWGANVIGGIWLLLFGNFGLVGLRFAGALVSILTVIAAYFILKEYIEEKVLLLGTLISFLFCYHFLTLTIMRYENLSVLFFVLSIFFLTKGLKKNSSELIFIAGFILSFNIFVRLPNVLGLLFISAIAFNAHIKNLRPNVYLKQYLTFVTGMLFSIIAVYFVMKALGHDYYYREALHYLIGATKISHGPYNLQKGLLFPVIKGYFSLFGNAALMLSIVSLIIFLYLKFDRISLYIKTVLFLFFLLLLYFNYNLIGVPIGGRIASLLTGICYVVLALHILNYKKIDKDFSLIAFLLLILFIIIPLGSGAGFVNSIYVIPVSFPIAVSYIHNIKEINFSLNLLQYRSTQSIASVINDGMLKKSKSFILIVFALYALTNAFAFSYDDAYNRFLLDTPVNHKYLGGIYTTKEKAAPLNELLPELSRHVRKGDTLLVTWIAPIIYYLTETKPYFPHPWTEIYSKEQVIKFFEKDRDLPVIVRYNYANRHEYDDIIYDFLKRNPYEEAWHNDIYKVYTPALHQTGAR